MSDVIRIQLLSHSEKIAKENPFPKDATGDVLLYHQWRTYHALQTHSLVVNTYNTGTGKTRASLLHLLDPKARGKNVLLIAPTNELIAQHVGDVRSFIQRAKLDYHVIPVDAKELRALPNQDEHERVGEKLNRLIQNPRGYGFEGRKPIAMVTNPDIFYYALYFSAYNRHDRRNLFEQFISRFDYVIVDEFHYYSPKQLATFLYYFELCKEWGYFQDGRKICLLSATPEPEVLEYLNRIFDVTEVALISPAHEPSDSASLSTIPALAPIDLEIRQMPLDEYLGTSQAQKQLHMWITGQNRDGAIISGALWRVNVAHAHLQQIFSAKMSRITGAEKTEQRQIAPTYPLILATPTVDIGYNFDKPGKQRQPIDFVLFDARTRDQFLQRLGRAGRVLGRTNAQSPSYAIGFINNESDWNLLKPLDGQTLERSAFTSATLNAISPRKDLYSYMHSYGMMEVLRPLFNLKRITRPDLNDWLEKLFEGVKRVFAPDDDRWRFWSIEKEMRKIEKFERIVRHKEYDLLTDVFDKYIEWQQIPVTSEQFANLKTKLGTSQIARQQVLKWVEEQLSLAEALFSFRESLDTPSACVFDPKHLLADSEVTVYDSLHVAMNFEIEWFDNEKDFANKTKQQPEKAIVYAQIKDHRNTRLRFDFEYVVTDRLNRERFEQIYCYRPVALIGLRLRAELANGNGAFPIDERIRKAFVEKFVPVLLVADKTLASGIMRQRLQDTNIFIRHLRVLFLDGTTSEYLAVIGSAVFTVHGEMEKVFWAIQRKEDSKPIIIG